MVVGWIPVPKDKKLLSGIQKISNKYWFPGYEIMDWWKDNLSLSPFSGHLLIIILGHPENGYTIYNLLGPREKNTNKLSSGPNS